MTEADSDGNGNGRSSTRKFSNRPNGAYKLLVHILYGHYSYLHAGPRGLIHLESIRKLGRLLGTQSATVNLWLSWLEDQGYIASLVYTEDRRQAQFRVRFPTNMIF